MHMNFTKKEIIFFLLCFLSSGKVACDNQLNSISICSIYAPTGLTTSQQQP